jgi:hypothetical protein
LALPRPGPRKSVYGFELSFSVRGRNHGFQGYVEVEPGP